MTLFAVEVYPAMLGKVVAVDLVVVSEQIGFICRWSQFMSGGF